MGHAIRSTTDVEAMVATVRREFEEMPGLTLTADQADKLLTNGLYVNIHSAAYPQGEIRGDIRKK